MGFVVVFISKSIYLLIIVNAFWNGSKFNNFRLSGRNAPVEKFKFYLISIFYLVKIKPEMTSNNVYSLIERFYLILCVDSLYTIRHNKRFYWKYCTFCKSKKCNSYVLLIRATVSTLRLRTVSAETVRKSHQFSSVAATLINHCPLVFNKILIISFAIMIIFVDQNGHSPWQFFVI